MKSPQSAVDRRLQIEERLEELKRIITRAPHRGAPDWGTLDEKSTKEAPRRAPDAQAAERGS